MAVYAYLRVSTDQQDVDNRKRSIAPMVERNVDIRND